MNSNVRIGISNRHVHLTKEAYDMLFDMPIEVDRMLTQPGEFASKQRLTISNGDKKIEGVRVLGPLRKYNQVEISHKDALNLKLNPPVRASGDLDGAEKITLTTDKGSITVNAAIIAERHLHLTPSDAEKFGLIDKQIVKLAIPGIKSGIVDVHVKIGENMATEVHIDTDDANAFILNEGDEGTLLL